MESILGYLNAKDFGACGSAFETVGQIEAGSNRLTVNEIGDFAIGQEVNMSGCLPRCDCFRLFGPRPNHARHQKVENQVKLRGWDASNGNHVVYVMDIDRECPNVFR